jgi:predicted enzyme related to lactoylglutathione lyase
MARPVVHWEIGARHAAALRQFYGELFDWEITGDASYGLVSAVADGIGGGILQTSPGVPSYVTIYVAVDDLESALEHATRLGGRSLLSRMPIPGVGAFAMFADPEGNPIGLMEEAQTDTQ